ncbi:MAG: hypothetical protein JXX29_05365 [Deltaproteobacteria bacterium]|nr:hypothetical protein [Deltaproteobacteria bacterium]MBN2671077.1 hypothetical protein [Deltaproteobacteria bacterium]
MSANLSFIQYIEQALRGLMVLLTGGAFGADGFDNAALQARMEAVLTRPPQMSAMLVLECDGDANNGDVAVIQRRLERFRYDTQIMEQKDGHIILHITGPSFDRALFAQLIAPGRLAIGSMEPFENWRPALPDEPVVALRVETKMVSGFRYQAIVAPTDTPLRPLADILKRKGFHPFVYCAGDYDIDSGCLLQVISPETRISNTDITAAYVSTNAPEQSIAYHLTLSTETALRFEQLTARNIHRPLPISLDGTAMSMPIVQEPIPEGELQITGFYLFENGTPDDEWLNAHLFIALVGNPPLKSQWRVVHMEPVDTPAN